MPNNGLNLWNEISVVLLIKICNIRHFMSLLATVQSQFMIIINFIIAILHLIITIAWL